MRPEWVMVLIAGLGISGHLLMSARDRGRWEQKLEDLAAAWDRMRGDVDGCQQIEICTGQMAAVSSRVDNSHKRMDRIEERLVKVEGNASELKGAVTALQHHK
jgi:hypothetical protein